MIFGFPLHFTLLCMDVAMNSEHMRSLKIISWGGGEGDVVASTLNHPKLGGLVMTHFFKCVVEVPNPRLNEEQP